jgi:hypothetical protein
MPTGLRNADFGLRISIRAADQLNRSDLMKKHTGCVVSSSTTLTAISCFSVVLGDSASREEA